MELKEYQRWVVERYDHYLKTLSTEKQKAEKAIKVLKERGLDIPGGMDDWPKNAWK